MIILFILDLMHAFKYSNMITDFMGFPVQIVFSRRGHLERKGPREQKFRQHHFREKYI